MRWPFISRDYHETIVAELRQRIADTDLERKKAQDEMVRLLGGRPYNFPEKPEEPVEQAATPEQDEDDRAAYLEYLRKLKPSQFAAELARERMRQMDGPPSIPRQQVAQAFDQAEQEAKQNTNGHPAN